MKPLLTIAIPTWNRGSILELSLQRLLPQISKYNDEIELIISDNDSDDNTNEVIVKYLHEFNLINSIHFKQLNNTGYYGNFKKCKELSNGNFFWLLSDNEIVNDNLIEFIINLLNRESNISAIHLSDWSNYRNNKSFEKVNYHTKIVDNELLLKLSGYKLTLISSVIFLNNKTNEIEIFEKFFENTFLGFQLFLSSIDYSKKAIVINGKSLISVNALISFNVFHSFAIDLNQCIKYSIKNKILTDVSAENFMNNIIFNLTKDHYLKYKIEGKLYGKEFGSIDEIDNLLYTNFNSYSGYLEYLYPLKNKSRFYLILFYNIRKVAKKIIYLFNY